MDYEYTSDEKFYSDLSKTLNELLYTENFPIPQEAKKKLWFQIYETAQRYEEQKQLDLTGMSQQLGGSLTKLGENIGYILNSANEILPELNRAKVNGQIALAKINDVNGTMKEVLKEQHKLESKLTTELAVKTARINFMKNQRN